jgi:hypothetical protein
MAAASKAQKWPQKCEDEGVKRFGSVLLGLAAFGSALACGPSFQAIYEGNARFEHCYALEENAATVIPEKADCWRDWSEHYTYGQTRDRIHYATARYVALSQSSNVPTDEAMMMAAPGMTPRQSTITAPAPTNAFAPPPKVLEDYGDASTARPARPSEVPTVVGVGGSSTGVDAGAPKAAPAAASAPVPALPASDCGEGCKNKFRDCDAGQCDKTYRACMRACFK